MSDSRASSRSRGVVRHQTRRNGVQFLLLDLLVLLVSRQTSLHRPLPVFIFYFYKSRSETFTQTLCKRSVHGSTGFTSGPIRLESGVRGHRWGQRSPLKSEVNAEVRGHRRGQRSPLGSEVTSGVRGHHQGQRSLPESKVTGGVRGHRRGQRSPLLDL